MARPRKPKTDPPAALASSARGAPSTPDPRAPLDLAAWVGATKRLHAELGRDLARRVERSPALTQAIAAQHQAEREAGRTGDDLLAYSERLVGQIAAAWILSVVFVRVLEDRGLLGRYSLAGPGARDRQRQLLQLAPYLSERDYLTMVFRELGRYPALADLFDPRRNLAFALAPSVEGARALLDLVRAGDAEAPVYRFGQSDTRFLGDLYQELDEEVRKRYALLQTPHFVESFILDRTLEPALCAFGLDGATVLDPTCGSGHFLLGAFERLYERRLHAAPGLGEREAARWALGQVYGVDINPYAVSIARFRLLLAYLDKVRCGHIGEAPELGLTRQVVVADSLLHNLEAKGQVEFGDRPDVRAAEWKGEVFALGDEAAVKAVLGRRYAAVVGNPPYITPKDPVLREEYRRMYRAAAGKYALAAPFTERFFGLAREGGFVGMINANSFMKREFGKKLIEEVLPGEDLELVVNTAGAYIPGHGTPTVLLFGRRRTPVGKEVLVVLGKRGEPATPEDPARGLVWSSMAGHWNEVGFENEYISVARVERATLGKHPWSLGGGGVAELKEMLEEKSKKRLKTLSEDIGFASFTGLDDIFIIPPSLPGRRKFADSITRLMVIGESIRDWSVAADDAAIAPYDAESHEPLALDPDTSWARFPGRYTSLTYQETVLTCVHGFICFGPLAVSHPFSAGGEPTSR